MRRRRVKATEVPRFVYDRYNDWVDRGFKDTPFTTGSSNYFTSSSGRDVTNWPRSLGTYRAKSSRQ